MNVREFAQQKMESVSPLMHNRTKIATSELYGKTITMVNFDIVVSDDGDYVVILLKEYPDCFMYGGKVLTELCKAIEDEFGDNIEAELEAVGGIPMILSECKTKDNKKTYTKVEIL